LFSYLYAQSTITVTRKVFSGIEMVTPSCFILNPASVDADGATIQKASVCTGEARVFRGSVIREEPTSPIWLNNEASTKDLIRPSKTEDNHEKVRDFKNFA